MGLVRSVSAPAGDHELLRAGAGVLTHLHM